MRASVGAITLMLVICLALPSGASAARKASKDQQREDVRKATRDILARLYKVQPGAKSAVEKAAGYAVFSNFGMKILVAGGGSGKGLAVSNASKKETFMKMVEIQAGLGFGVKKFQLVWVFEAQAALDTFTNSGWELGAQTTAGAAVKGEGMALQGALSVSPGVWLYQLTDTGLALELTAKGTKYYKDDDLN
ncbi:MAG TPA: YSC84-related protein [Candidatus Methylomirabilis sp.]|nr:YSC84-related protein [Candidatus Methylomirabilis sp.]